jgi:hypothetical protein
MTKLTTEEKEEMVNTISARVIAALEEPIKNIARLQDSMQKSLDINLGDMGEDRKHLAAMAIDAAATAQGVRELVQLSNKQTSTIAQKVADKAGEMIDNATSRVAEAVGPEMARQVKKLNHNAQMAPEKNWWERAKLFVKGLK